MQKSSVSGAALGSVFGSSLWGGGARARRRRGSVRALALLLALGIGSPAFAADEKKDFSMRPWVANQLTEATELLGDKKYKDALETLKDARDRGKLSPHEKAMVTQTEGYVYHSQTNYVKAAESFEKALETDAMPDQSVLELHYNLGQLYQVQKKYKRALVHLLKWVKLTKSPKPRDYFMIATTYIQADMNSRALSWARKAVTSSRKPEEDWLQVLSMLLFEKKAYGELPGVLNQLATLYPKKMYYDQLFAVHAKEQRYADALSILELEYRQDFLKKSEELENLAIMYLQNGVPLKGAAVMKEGLENGNIKKSFKTYQLHSECLLGARELDEAIGPLSKAAALKKRSKQAATMYMRIAEIHTAGRRWSKARDALEKALKTGKLGNEQGVAYLLLGIANLREERFSQAKVAFRKAGKHKRFKKAATQWLNVLDSKTS